MPEPQKYHWRRHGKVKAIQWLVEAIQWLPDGPEGAGVVVAAAKWLMDHGYKPEVQEDFVTGELSLAWRDRFGLHKAEPGSWIVCDETGWFWAFSADYFASRFTPMVDA